MPRGYPVTVFETEAEAGGMLVSAIPPYRLPREVVRREIASLIDENVTFLYQQSLGSDFTLDNLFKEGFQAIFLATGAHKSRSLNLEGEKLPGVVSALPFLKAANLEGKDLAKGRVVVIGGGNSAVDADRVARRQKGVESVTILYRRTREEMPAYAEEIQAALEEGIRIEPHVSPVKILDKDGRLAGIKCVRNTPGPRERSGREVTPSGAIWVNPATLQTSCPGIFAGGDAVSGPNTVVSAIAAGKRAAAMIDQYLRGKDLRKPTGIKLPEVFVEPVPVSDPEITSARRVEPHWIPAESRVRSMAEVEQTLSAEEAAREARRCLRCDLDFTQQPAVEPVAQKGVRNI
ncbi:MAG: FAD-dependent oxidoreductase [Deltaproteobacteria bacterium]|nr:FAD-dependent oxidoreductase [Deltaproteobacteria bacterium]